MQYSSEPASASKIRNSITAEIAKIESSIEELSKVIEVLGNSLAPISNASPTATQLEIKSSETKTQSIVHSRLESINDSLIHLRRVVISLDDDLEM